jgi:hypothetical protein
MGGTVPGVAKLSNLAGSVRGGIFWRFCAVIFNMFKPLK